MTERRAWLTQSESDLDAVTYLFDSDDPKAHCHVIAKCQQAVEKSMKSLVASLRDAGILGITIGYRHEVARFLTVLIHMPHAAEHRSVQARIHRLFDAVTRREINALDGLVPRRPPPGGFPMKNTEYPYQTAAGGIWYSPADESSFTIEQVRRFRNLAHRLVIECGKLVSLLERSIR
jgi:HEPN domain-containing protein